MNTGGATLGIGRVVQSANGDIKVSLKNEISDQASVIAGQRNKNLSSEAGSLILGGSGNLIASGGKNSIILGWESNSLSTSKVAILVSDKVDVKWAGSFAAAIVKGKINGENSSAYAGKDVEIVAKNSLAMGSYIYLDQPGVFAFNAQNTHLSGTKEHTFVVKSDRGMIIGTNTSQDPAIQLTVNGAIRIGNEKCSPETKWAIFSKSSSGKSCLCACGEGDAAVPISSDASCVSVCNPKLQSKCGSRAGQYEAEQTTWRPFSHFCTNGVIVDWSEPTFPAPWTEVKWKCGTTLCSAKRKAASVVYACTGKDPENAHLITGDDQGLTVNTPKKLVKKDTAAKCEYLCDSGYEFKSWKCEKKADSEEYKLPECNPDAKNYLFKEMGESFDWNQQGGLHTFKIADLKFKYVPAHTAGYAATSDIYYEEYKDPSRKTFCKVGEPVSVDGLGFLTQVWKKGGKVHGTGFAYKCKTKDSIILSEKCEVKTNIPNAEIRSVYRPKDEWGRGHGFALFCKDGYKKQGNRCVALACIGDTPANAHLIPGDDQGLTSETPKKLVENDSHAKCEYVCNIGYVLKGWKCEQLKGKCWSAVSRGFKQYRWPSWGASDFIESTASITSPDDFKQACEIGEMKYIKLTKDWWEWECIPEGGKSSGLCKAGCQQPTDSSAWTVAPYNTNKNWGFCGILCPSRDADEDKYKYTCKYETKAFEKKTIGWEGFQGTLSMWKCSDNATDNATDNIPYATCFLGQTKKMKECLEKGGTVEYCVKSFWMSWIGDSWLWASGKLPKP